MINNKIINIEDISTKEYTLYTNCIFYNCDFIFNKYIENNWYNNYGKNLRFIGALPNFIKENTFLNLKVIQ